MRGLRPIRKPVQRVWFDVLVTYTVLVPVKLYNEDSDEIQEAFEPSEDRETVCRVLSPEDGSEIEKEVRAKMKLVYSKKNKGQPQLDSIIAIGAPARTQLRQERQRSFIHAAAAALPFILHTSYFILSRKP